MVYIYLRHFIYISICRIHYTLICERWENGSCCKIALSVNFGETEKLFRCCVASLHNLESQHFCGTMNLMNLFSA